MVNIWRGVAQRLRRSHRQKAADTPTPARFAKRRAVAALRRRRLVYAPELDGQADPGEIV